MGRKKKKQVKPWCWYCSREFEDEKILVQHQKAKHFKCPVCYKKLTTGPGLALHCVQVHKEKVDKIPNALPHRTNVEIEIYGMEGIPPEDAREHERQKYGGKDDGSDEDSRGPSTSGYVTAIAQASVSSAYGYGVPPIPPPVVPAVGVPSYAAPRYPPMPPPPSAIPTPPMLPYGGVAPRPPLPYAPPVYGLPIGRPSLLPPSIAAPAGFPAAAIIPPPPSQPLFPSAMIAAQPPPQAIAAESAGQSEYLNHQQSSTEQSGEPTVRIMHPDEDFSLEEIRARMPQYAKLVPQPPPPIAVTLAYSSPPQLAAGTFAAYSAPPMAYQAPAALFPGYGPR